ACSAARVTSPASRAGRCADWATGERNRAPLRARLLHPRPVLTGRAGAVQFGPLRRLLPRRPGAEPVAAALAGRAEADAAGGELLLLRPVGMALPAAGLVLDHRRLPDRAA